MIQMLIYILVMAIVFGLVIWILGQLSLPEPYALIVRVVCVLIFLLILLGLVFGGVSFPELRFVR